MSTHAGDIYIDARLNDKPFKQGMSKLDSTAGKLAGKVGKKIAAALSIAAFGKFIKDTTAAGASLNAMNAIVDAALPNMTAQVDKFAKSAGAAFGLSETQAKSFVGKFASMASAFGFTEKQAYNLSTALTGLAGDVASYYHITQDEAFTKLQSVFTGETETLKSLGVVMTQNALDAFAMANGFGKVTNQMSESEKVALRYQFVMDKLKLTAGDFAKYASTWSGSIATIKLNWQNFMSTVGQGIINILLPLLQIIAKVSNALTALGSRFVAWTEKITGKSKGAKNALKNAFGKGTQKDLTNSTAGIGNVGSGLKNASTNAGKAKKAVQALKRELMGFDQITKLTKQDSSTGTTGSSGVGGGGGTVDVGSLDFGTAEADAQNFADKINDIFSNIKIPDVLKDAIDHLKSAFSGFFDLLKDVGAWTLEHVLKPLGEWYMNSALPAGINLIASAIDVLSAAFRVIFDILKLLWEPIFKPFFEFCGTVAVTAANVLTTALENLAKFLNIVADAIEDPKAAFEALKKKWEELKEAITGKALEFKADLKDTISEKIDAIKQKWNELKTFVSDKVVEFKAKIPTWEDIKAAFTTFTNSIKEHAKDLGAKITVDLPSWSDLKDKWNNLKNKFTGKSVKIGLTLPKWSSVKSKWNSLMGKFKGKTAEIGLKFSAAASDLKAWINSNVIGKVNSAFSKVPILKNHKIPYLASGAYVKANTPQLAVVGDNRHEGEVVSPESKLEAMARKAANDAAGAGNTEVIALLKQLIGVVQGLNLNVELDGEKIKKNTVRRINNHTRATGKLELIV